MYLRKNKTHCTALQILVQWRGRGEVLQVLEQRLPAACGDDHEEAAVLLKPMEVHGGAVENAAPLPSQGRSLLQPLRAGLSAKLMLGA